MRRSLVALISLILVLALPTLIDFQPIIQTTKAQPNNSFSDNFSTDSGEWLYLGNAYRDTANQYLVLTPVGHMQAGVVFFKSPIPGPFTASFSYKAGGGDWQGDGFTMFFYKQQYPSTLDNNDSFDSNGVAGGNLGFNSQMIIPGYGIEFDAWANWACDWTPIVGGQPNPLADPSDHHIALIKDFTGDHLAYENDSRVADNNWHQVTVDVQESSVDVYVDQALVLHWEGALNTTYDGFGFSGATGGNGGDCHLIDNVSITANNLHTSTLTTSCATSTTQQIFNVYNINGALTFNGEGISQAPILISYSVSGGDSWQDLTLVYTDSNGNYSAMWLPTVTGNYLLKSIFKGDENYLGSSSIISFSIEPSTDQNVFTITSNSTITALSFNPANKQLSFNVSGDPGTKGYLYVFIPKSLMNDSGGLNVQLDGNQTDFTVQSQNDGWLLYLTYHHSTHIVTVSLDSSVRSASEKSSIQFNVGDYIFVLVCAAIAIIAVVLFVGLRAWKKDFETHQKQV